LTDARSPANRRPAPVPAGRTLALIALGVVGAIAGLYVLLPAIAGLDETWRRLATGDPWWLSAALGLELASFGFYMALFRAVFTTADGPLPWRDCYLITVAGVAATRLFAAAGAGGIALTAWALRRHGLPGRYVTVRIAAFLLLLYAVFMGALVIGGLGLRTGVLAGPAPFGLTVVPAAFGGFVVAAILLIAAVSEDLDQALARLSRADGTAARWAGSVATAPATIASGVAEGLTLLRSRKPGLVGAIGWWAFDIAVLWACLKAFGEPPTVSVVVMAYFVGTLANVLPVPGGIGAVEGGIIGALIGFGVSGGLAIVAVLSYRAFAFWLPTLPGAIAYLQLLRDSRSRRSLNPA
jgi:uncharacterized membrane protein YbhN (UPF0104 family)